MSRGHGWARGALAAAALLAVAVPALPACGPAYGADYLLAFRAGERAYEAGRWDEAGGEFERAARLATRVKDRDEARFMQARSALKLGRHEQARAAYVALAAATPTGPRAARALFDIAELDIDHGDAALGWRELEEALVAHPSHGSARVALTRICDHRAETEGETAVRAWLEARLPGFAGSEAEEQAKYGLARSFERGGSLDEAHAAYLRVAREHPYPHGSLHDDALYRASELAERMGRYELAIADLRALLAVREVALGGQSYERPRMPMAQMRIAELHRDRLNDPEGARREYRRMYETHPSSLLADDAIWQEALLARAAGDGARACEVAATIEKDFARSRYARCVAVVCPSAAPPEGERPCPRYIAAPGEPADGAADE
ncbi:MAG: tetratricopeptide repeat protein [Myxococcales bacterium]|nr:tetratricopeptide repeat protein [Myxococcales bacterium]